MSMKSRIGSEAQACVRITNKDLVCKGCKFVLSDRQVYGNTSRCKKYHNKPNTVLKGGDCNEYQPKG